MGEKEFLEAIYKSMQESAREIRRSLGRPSSHATRQQALKQVAMLKAAKEAQQNRGINTIIYPSTTGGYLLAVPKLFVPLQ